MILAYFAKVIKKHAFTFRGIGRKTQSVGKVREISKKLRKFLKTFSKTSLEIAKFLILAYFANVAKKGQLPK